MGNGKRASPRERGEKVSRQRARRGLKLVEIVAELVHNGIASLKEIAGLTDRQLAEVYFRKRDKHGRLVRGKRRASEDRGEVDLCPKTKAWQKTSFTGAFQKAWKDRGLTDEEVAAKWLEYVNLPKNRSLKAKLAQNARMRFGRNGS